MSRHKMLSDLLLPIFERKDAKRQFSEVQRRVIWNKDEARKCARCKKKLTWNDFTVDHMKAHSKGGKTGLRNAQLMCGKCNSRKGAR